MHQMMGNLFYRGASPTELMSMSFGEIAYWNEWHLVLTKAEKAAMPKVPKR